MGTASCSRCGGAHSEGECATLRLDARDGEATRLSPAPSARAAGLSAGARLGRYEVLGLIGSGGMGAVYRARDVELGREVALKVLLAGEHASQEALERFHREAALVARMGKHPHIVQVHDIGVEGARHWFTMDLVEGTSLRGWLRGGRAPREVMGLAHKVAGALAHAHSHGVVHRDLKADNVLVDAHGEPQVTDFGLAREVQGPSHLSLTGQVMGTPAFMAPEQAAGRMSEVGPWTDVYAFGAMLYDAFAGHPPHAEKEIGPLLEAVMRRDAKPLRREAPSVSPEIETIVMKCLERRPEQRYRDGAALEAEVGRYLNGEPISARPVGAVSRALRRVRRNPAVGGLLAAVVVLLCVAGAIAGWAAWSRAQARGREQALVDDYLRELSRSGGALVEAALARRAVADLEGMRRFESDLAAPVQELKRRAADRAEPWYYEGRMKRAQGKADEAERCQREAVALASAPGATEGSRAVLGLALYECGVLEAARYQAERDERRLELIRMRAAGQDPRSPPPPIPTTEEVLRAFPDLATLRELAVGQFDAFLKRGASGPRADTARAVAGVLRAEPLSEKEQADAVNRATTALADAIVSNRFFTEAYELFAGILSAQARFEEAEKVYAAGHENDKGYLPFLRGAARALLEAASREEGTGSNGADSRRRAREWVDRLLSLDGRDAMGWALKAEATASEAADREAADEDPLGLYSEAASACAKALSFDPACLDALRMRAQVAFGVADHLSRSGGDPSGDFRKAVEGLKAVLVREPRDVVAMDLLARACIRLAQWSRDHGGDPRPWYEEGEREARALVEAYPANSAAVAGLADALEAVGDWRRVCKEDPSECYREAEDDLERARELTPGDAGPIAKTGNLYLTLGLWKEAQGKDPSQEYAEAKRWHEEARKVSPSDPMLAQALAQDERNLADSAALRGEDPTEAYRRAISFYEEMARARPRWADAVLDVSTSWRALADWQAKHGRDPMEALHRSVEAAQKAEGMAPSVEDNASGLGAALLALGDARSDRGEDPTEDLAQAARWYERSLNLLPQSRTSMASLALVWRLQGEWEKAHGKDPRESFGKSIAAYERRIQATPLDAWVEAQVATVLSTLGDSEDERRQDPLEAYRRSLGHIERALALDADKADWAIQRAQVLVRIGEREKRDGGGGDASYRSALAGCDALLAKDPRQGPAHAYRGRALEGLGRLDEAVEAYRRAAALCPERKVYLSWLVNAHFALLGDAAPRWQRDGREGTLRVSKGDLRGGRDLLEQSVSAFEREMAGLPEAERRARSEDPVARFVAGNAFYNLACMLSLASAGKGEKRGETGAVSDADAARFRDEAFERLGRAFEVGFANRSLLDSDADLAPLRADARWESVRKRLAAEGPPAK